MHVEFRDILEQIRSFAAKHGLDSFENCFVRALEDLTAEKPWNGFHKELLSPSLLTLDALQLLSAAQSSWVFGGMGSWNDLGFEGDEQQTYERLSEALYKIANWAIVAATNSSVGSSVTVAAQSSSNALPKQKWWRLFS
ncbi:hypothetical protein [Xanthomonas albilineans]|uniref:hypothetical protein n=1 Tax=Xanthomonas albilineans TaxID=29447 RepID=UPI0012D40CB0|nr:hypothetical protein [Xanthomonas albilineans]